MVRIFKKGNIVQRLQGGPVMRVVDVSKHPDGTVFIDAVVVHGDSTQIEQFLPEQIKVIGHDGDDDFDDENDGDHSD